MRLPYTFLLFISYGISFYPAHAQHYHADNPIRLNQAGYYPRMPKVAIVADADEAKGGFALVGLKTGDTVWRGTLGQPVRDPYSGRRTAAADFSAFSRPGRYFLVTDRARSYPFQISDTAWHALSRSVLKAYYFLRCSEALLPAYAGKWARAAGHPDTTVYIHPSAASAGRPAGTVIRSPGGWYDAGDYNKYIVNCGITMATLLAAYEDFPHYFNTLNTGIPESGDGLPDLLNEVRWNLRWMLTMQDPADGGVYHKLTTARFDAMEMPRADHATRYVVMKTTAATLDFAAVMARASRVFRPFTPRLADSCLKAARLAWGWATRHPDIFYDLQAMNKRFIPPVTTGAYGDRQLKDERFWAATELWTATGAPRYRQAWQAAFPAQLSVPYWGQVRTLGYYTLLGSSGKADSLRGPFLRFADSLLERQNPAYRTVMGGRAGDFVWGSNAVAANQGIVLVKAYRLSGDRRYLEAAAANMDYLLGRNATGYCFVTGEYPRSPVHPHHRPSIADGITPPVPGMLTGGPNPGQQDKRPGYPSRAADESYTDDPEAYACNEIAINWNAPLVYLAGALAALLEKK